MCSNLHKWLIPQEATVYTSPNAPRPMIVRSSKSSTPILCRCNRMYSVSLRSNSFNRFCSSSGDTSPSAIFRSRVHRLPHNHHQIQSPNFCTNISFSLSLYTQASKPKHTVAHIEECLEPPAPCKYTLNTPPLSTWIQNVH